MSEIDDSARRGHSLNGVRWLLIAVCAGLILVSDNMAGRLGFAVLLLLAIVIGRYASRRTRVLDAETLPTSPAAKPSDPELPRREAGH
jgi:hypothetical protein